MKYTLPKTIRFTKEEEKELAKRLAKVSKYFGWGLIIGAVLFLLYLFVDYY